MNIRLLLRVVRAQLTGRLLAGCGHYAERSGAITVNGQTVQLKLPRGETKVARCFDCTERASVPCAVCGYPVTPGGGIRLADQSLLGVGVPPGAVLYQSEPLLMIGCMGGDCQPFALERIGYWAVGPDGLGYIQHQDWFGRNHSDPRAPVKASA